MHTRRQLGTRFLALSMLFAGRGLPAFAAERTVLRFGSISVAGGPTYSQQLEPFARKIESASDGRLELALKPAGGYGKPTDITSLVEKGEIEMGASVQGYAPGKFLQTSVIELPLMFEHSLPGTRALVSLYKEGLLAKDYAGFKVLALYASPPFGLFTTGKKIASLRDLRGMRIRVPGATVGLALVRLGAIPLGIPASMIGDAIANGTVDAIAFSMDSTLGTKGAGGKYLYEQLSVAVDMRFAAPAQMIVMHPAAWDALPGDLQNIIQTCSDEFVWNGVKLREDAEAQARTKFQEDPRYTFVPFSQQLHDEMQRALAPVYDDWKTDMAKRGYDGEGLLTRARELIQQSSVASK